ncbi:hypothetical protein IP78_10005 [Brevundimonas sp. AAP58]|uniref:OmpH family outer membrane protein n=1 Tax=Brevundimonas sp. AAP58 TaxID=1523422 RepID=UPI0006B9B031|nr:OmpH family outer membrane protein [Brevundimonas sp. AAP58]KPF78993.1 hypothetical protein IP78_10005 [Brevundimonas sp. AAP58]
MKLLAIGAAALVSLIGSTAVAQTQGVANPGPVIPGVCVYFNQRLLSQSTVGQSVQARMAQLAQEVQVELQPYGPTIESEIQRLRGLGDAAPEADVQALQARISEARQLEQTRENELRYTRSEQIRLITEAVDPILLALYQERGCGILIDRTSVFIMNPAMDITDAAIERLNTQLPSLSFNRLAVPVQAAQ